MTSPQVHVAPADLRAAGGQLASVGQGVRDTPPPDFGGASTSLTSFATAESLVGSDDTVESAMTTIAGRCEQFGDAMRVGGNFFTDTDEVAAAQLKAMGNLNESGS